MENPKGIQYSASYEPDMDKMVKALRIVKDSPLVKPKVESQQKQSEKDSA
ncbi:hypothetical protein [Paenibacillus monticola]|uniref:Uncharacterized protein n=1 Tax=Paenibacillus monticola TaxID=2666075 RepID=A0A7X2HAZ4_9BACL|nr:hypothetical protein [Paenibacillus monticola]MRN56792.1 hypothetical protein [Paenibacillus monticola]